MISLKKFFRNPNRIYMVPTRYGAIASGLFILLTITGAHYSNNLIFLFAFILVSFLLIAIMQTAKNMRGIQVTRIYIHDGFPKDISRVEFYVRNVKSSEKIGIGIQLKGQKSSAMISEIHSDDEQMIVTAFVLPEKRGRHIIERVKIFTDAPYGLFYGWYYNYFPTSYVVYPVPKGNPLQVHTDISKGLDFSGLREYVVGDTLSRMSWKHSARRDSLILKEFNEQEKEQEIFSLKDCPQKNIEDQLSQLSLWVTLAEENQFRYGLSLPNSKILAQNGKSHLKKCLYSLAVFEA